MKIIHFLFVYYVYYTLLCRINNLKILIMKNFSINAETKGIRNSEKRAIKLKSRFQNEVGMFDNECKKCAIISVEEIIIAFDEVMIPNPFKQY